MSKKIFKRGLSLLMTGAMCASVLAGCGGSATASSVASETGQAATQEQATTEGQVANQTKSDETLVVLLEVEPVALTNLNNAAAGQVFPEAISSSLFRYNGEEGTVEPELAESYEKIDDTHYRFHLREGVEYADGTPVTANDVLYSFQCYKKLGFQDIGVFDVDNFVVEDDHTFVLALEHYAAGWEMCLGQGTTAIYSEAAVEAAGGLDAPNLAPVSCGRYNVKEWKPGEYLLVERNENYWDKDYVGYYKYIKFQFVSDAASRVMAVRSGDADIANSITVADYIALQNDPTAYGYISTTNGVFTAVFNCESGPCSDAKVREAICHAVDPEAFNSVMNLGLGEPAQAIWSKSFPLYKDYYGGTLYDPEKSKEILKEIGKENGLTVSCLIFPVYKDAAAVLQESLRQVGITMEINMMDNATWTPLVKSGEFDITIGDPYGVRLCPNAFNSVNPDMIGSAAYSIRMDTPELREALNKVNNADETIRNEGMDELYDIVLGQYTCVGLCSGAKYVAVKKGITGLTMGHVFEWLDVSECHPE